MRYVELRTDGTKNLIITRQEADKMKTMVIPIECVSIRAGEYGLDPIDDIEDVLDILLHENDKELFPEEHPILVTADTLEEARDEVLRRCKSARDEHYVDTGIESDREMDETHVDVLEALKEAFTKDRQLATLFRLRTKTAVFSAKDNIGITEPSLKSKMIDRIRQEEEV